MMRARWRRRRRALVLVYLALLMASHLYRRWIESPEGGHERRVVTLRAVDASAQRLPEPVQIAYRDWRPDAPSGAPPVVMLHGSPGSSADFRALGPALAAGRRIIAPDLPGFGASTRSVPDYSIRAHADYVLQLLDELGVERFDLVGFSMGGGVAAHLADLAPERARSLVLLASIGVQELELLGNYELNHAVHGLQLAGLWLLHEAVPHFGALDDVMLSVEYARNFYDTDQRPLREILGRLSLPTLILHGGGDPLVPLEAAMEHHRVLPQSRLVLFEGDHFMVFLRPDELVDPIEGFLGRVDAGRARTRADADAARRRAAARPFDPRARQPVAGFSLVMVILLLAAATLVSEDLACIAAGLLASQGAIDLLPAILGCFVGIVVGDIGLYWTGRLIGRRALAMPPFSWVVSETRVTESAAWFERRGPLVILLTRFIPGTRLPTYFSAGLLKTGFLRFSLFFLLASAIWTPLLVGLASLLGRRVFDYFEIFERHALAGLLVVSALAWAILEAIPVLASWRGRRLALGRWRRLTNWEFWPSWLLYLPVGAYIVWLGLRHRGMTLFTLANPGIELGGFVGESKGAVLEQLPAEATPRWRRFGGDDEDERAAALAEALAGAGISAPLVLKPDVGERGRGVVVARSLAAAEDYARTTSGPALAQDYVPGPEYGIFYVRRPGEERGQVTSIAAKVLPRVTGDGRSSLERLILADERTVCQAPIFLAAHESTLARVPAAGEEVGLGDLGTHARGALFLDAGQLGSPELERAIDRIAHSIEGFFFGRLDLRVTSEENLRLGYDLQVLEVNGVTSEEAHMYDPSHGVFYAWRILCSQWRTAFEIGRAHRDQGLEPASIAELVRAVRRYRQRRSEAD